MNTFTKINSNPSLQSTSAEILETKYLREGESIEGMFARVSDTLAGLEEKDQQKFRKEFLWALNNGAIPAGRILANIGVEGLSTSTINCTVAGRVGDSMDSILESNHKAGLTLKAGCGIGYEFSTLRPKGANVSGAGAKTSGPLSFMDIFDKTCFTVSSAGGRRGAQMATFDISHPDVLDFIKAKREDGVLRQFNLSLLITQEFIDCVVNDEEWALSFPVPKKEVDRSELDLSNKEEFIWREFPHSEGYVENEEGLVAQRIYNKMPAKRIWNLIMSSTYDFAEPGFILIDKVNEMNNNWFCENIRATNPCGEQPLPENGSCLLGSVNLTKMIGADGKFDFKKFKKVVKIFCRMLDNVVEINGLPLEAQRKEIFRKRRHGMGFFGLGSLMNMMGIAYGSPESVALTEEISKTMAIEGWKAALSLAKEKGAAPVMDEEFVISNKMMKQRPELEADGFSVGDKVTGSTLFGYSRYMQMIAKEEPKLVKDLIKNGARYTHHSSIAPTGTIALSVGNNASNGIEPSFSHYYFRNVIVEGRSAKKKVDVFSYELLHYNNANGLNEKKAPSHFIAADDVSPEQHVDVQAAAQKWIDSSISKTINVPTDISFDKFEGLYLYAAKKGLKGCTTFRFNPEVFQGVLVKEGDLKNTKYEFTLDDGSKVQLAGDEEVEYDGETHSAANLFDALKEGYYGKL